MPKRKNAELSLVRDTREQRPLDFSPFPFVTVEIGTLWPGDYSIRGYEHSIAWERKSVSDLIGTMKGGYVGRDSIRRYESRFDLELEEFERHFDRAFVIVEPDDPEVIRRAGGIPEGCGATRQIMNHWYRSAMTPEKVMSFLKQLSAGYGCHVCLCESREDAAMEIVDGATRYLAARRHVIHREKIRKADGEKPPPETVSPF